MSDEFRARVRDRIAAFNRGDLDGMLADYTPTSRYRIAREHPEARECVGRDEVRAYYRSWREQFDDLRLEATRIDVSAHHCLLAGKFIGRPGGSAELAVPVFVLVEFNDELAVVSAEEFLNQGEAERRFAERSRL